MDFEKNCTITSLVCVSVGGVGGGGGGGGGREAN